MTELNIAPAIDIPKDLNQQLSAEEFQHQLYGWFEARGMLSELRAHLRKKMIGVFNESSLGHAAVSQQKHGLSPKVQCLNLLIAEFLHCYNHHYSLSVFSTEVPGVSGLLDVVPSVNNARITTNQWRFAEKDTWDILDTMGIASESDLGKSIYQSYYKCNTDSLLTNIINSIKLTNKAVQFNQHSENLFTCNTYTEWMRNVEELLQVNNISTANRRDVINSLVNLIETERQSFRKATVNEFMHNQMELKNEFIQKQEEQTRKWSLIVTSLETEKSKLLDERAKKQREFEDLNVKIEQQQDAFEERYHALRTKEKELQKRECELMFMQECLQAQQHRLQAGLNNTRQEAKIDKSANKETSGDNHDLMLQLQIENKTLQNINTKQKGRIDELTERSCLLLRDLENTQPVLNAPPLVPPATTLQTGGAGEEGSAAPREFRNLLSFRDVKKRLPFRRINGYSSSTSDEGTASQILQDARDKLKRLEEESEEVDRRYQQFKLSRTQDQNWTSTGITHQYHSTSGHLISDPNPTGFTSKFRTNPASSSSSLMEYVPEKNKPPVNEPQRFDFDLRKPGPSNPQLCKSAEVSSISNTIDLDTSTASASNAG